MAIDPRKGGYYRSQREEARRQREVSEAMRQRRMREATGTPLTEEEEAEYREYIESREFGTFQVTPLPNDPKLYGRGPTQSTRLSAHKFVPSPRGTDAYDKNLSPNSGTVYVRFNRPSKQQPDPVIYRYKNVPVAVYESFRNNRSKGKFINEILNGYKDAMVTGIDNDWQLCADL